MFIQTESTPNPATLKFLPGREVMGEGAVADFPSAEAPRAARRWPGAVRDPRSVSRVFFGSDFISVTKRDGDWKHLKPAILGAIMEHFTAGLPLMEGSRAGAEEETVTWRGRFRRSSQQIKELIDTRVRPAVAQDGGDIIFKLSTAVQRNRLAASAGLLRRLPLFDHDAEERHREHAASLFPGSDRGRSGLILFRPEPISPSHASRHQRRSARHDFPQRAHPNAQMAGQAGLARAADGDL
jgi:hypothetical protein